MNKLIGLVFIAFAMLAISSCGDDSGSEELLHYDGDNVTGPQFNPGAFITAARFPGNIMAGFVGQTIDAVDLFILDQPADARLVILAGDPVLGEPTGEITGQSITSVIETDSWNRITLNTPYIVDGSEIWIGLDFSVTVPSQITGCDAGPADRNGDLLFQASENAYTTFRDLTNTESINWNIRGVFASE